jgi:hypothetical protein
MAQEWTKQDFSRRHYQVEGDTLDKARKIEVVVRVDGKTVVQVQAREPGILAFVSRPHDQGFDIEMVEARGVAFTDIRTISGDMAEPVAGWQWDALGIK